MFGSDRRWKLLAIVGVCMYVAGHVQARRSDFGAHWISMHPLTITAVSQDANVLDLRYKLGNFSCFAPYGSADQIFWASSNGLPWMGTFHTNWNAPFNPDAGAMTWIANYESGAPGGLGWSLGDEVIQVWMDKMAVLVNRYNQQYPDKLTWVGLTGLNLSLDYIYGGTAPGGYTVDTYLENVINTIKPDVLAATGFSLWNDSNNVQAHDCWFTNVMQVRQKSLKYNIPYFQWVQAYSKSADNIRFPSESDIRAEVYAALTTGSKGIVYGAYSGWWDKSIIDKNGTSTTLYAQVTNLNPKIAVIGKLLRLLTSTDVRFIPGKHLVSGSPVKNPSPSHLTDWSYGAGSDGMIQSIYIYDVNGTNCNIDKNGLAGFFTDGKGNTVVMLTNLYHQANVSASAGTMRLCVQFANSVKTIYQLNDTTGAWSAVQVPANHVLQMDLPGGSGQIFSYIPVPTKISDNYLLNGNMEEHWDNAPAMQLTYTGSGSDCRLQIDGASKLFKTVVDGEVDISVDLSDRVMYEEQFKLISYLNATGRYVAGTAAWNGHNYGCNGWSPTAQYTDVLNGAVNLKGNVTSIPEGNPSYWAGYGQSTSGSCMFAHTGKWSLQVYDNRPSGVPGSPVSASPESVNCSQSISDSNPQWTDLKGKKVILSGWVFAPANSWQNAGSTPGYLVRVTHGAGGSINTDLSSIIPTNEWVYFTYSFTVDQGSDQLKVILFAESSINQVYNGRGSVYYDDLSLKLANVNIGGDLNYDGKVDFIDLAFLAAQWMNY